MGVPSGGSCPVVSWAVTIHVVPSIDRPEQRKSAGIVAAFSSLSCSRFVCLNLEQTNGSYG